MVPSARDGSGSSLLHQSLSSAEAQQQAEMFAQYRELVEQPGDALLAVWALAWTACYKGQVGLLLR